jgi:hypothetical protein
LRAAPAKNATLSMVPGTSNSLASRIGLPAMRLSSCAISAARSESSRANVVSTAERSAGVVRDHSAYACRAACTARSTSSASATVISATTSPVLGSRTTPVFPLDASQVFPSMNWLIGVISLFMGCVVSSR